MGWLLEMDGATGRRMAGWLAFALADGAEDQRLVEPPGEAVRVAFQAGRGDPVCSWLILPP